MTSTRSHLAQVVVGVALTCSAGGVADAADAADAGTIASGLSFPEGLVFADGVLYLVDYRSSDLFGVIGGRLQRVWHRDGCGANGLLAVPEGLLVACFDDGAIETVSLHGGPSRPTDRDDAGAPFDRPNDFAVDARRGVYITASGSGRRSGKVYFRAPRSAPRVVAADIDFANGIGVSPDGRWLYVTESKTSAILRYAIEPDGSLGSRQVLVDLVATLGRPNTPDGLRVDRQGRLLVALYEGGGVVVFDDRGSLLHDLSVPGQHHTSVALDPDGKRLYVTAIDDSTGGAIYRIDLPPDDLRPTTGDRH